LGQRDWLQLQAANVIHRPMLRANIQNAVYDVCLADFGYYGIFGDTSANSVSPPVLPGSSQYMHY
jgi:hypothetical protein